MKIRVQVQKVEKILVNVDLDFPMYFRRQADIDYPLIEVFACIYGVRRDSFYGDRFLEWEVTVKTHRDEVAYELEQRLIGPDSLAYWLGQDVSDREAFEGALAGLRKATETAMNCTMQPPT